MPLENSRHEGETAEGYSSRARGHLTFPSGAWFGAGLARTYCWKKGAALLHQPSAPATHSHSSPSPSTELFSPTAKVSWQESDFGK